MDLKSKFTALQKNVESCKNESSHEYGHLEGLGIIHLMKHGMAEHL